MKITELETGRIQNLLKRNGMDGWLFTDFHGHDFITGEFLHLTGRCCTRRLFYYIPAEGEPVKLLSAIEPLLLEHLPGRRLLYRGAAEQKRLLGSFLRRGSRVACQYSPGGDVPTVSTVDAGLLEYLREFGILPVSSADLLQYFGAVLSDEQIESHRKAGVVIHQILDETFAWIRGSLDQGLAIDEWMLLGKMKELTARKEIVMDGAPFFGIDEHACDPGYEPQPEGSAPIREGSRLIIDIAGRLPGENTVFYDVSWCMNVGPWIDPEYERVFRLVYEARETARNYIENESRSGRLVRGCDVDALLRRFFKKAGMERYLMHRTGHNIGHECHGVGANLDDFETHDTRHILPGSLFSIEPGIYTDRYGVRLEYDVHLTQSGETRIYGPVQKEILVI